MHVSILYDCYSKIKRGNITYIHKCYIMSNILYITYIKLFYKNTLSNLYNCKTKLFTRNIF